VPGGKELLDLPGRPWRRRVSAFEHACVQLVFLDDGERQHDQAARHRRHGPSRLHAADEGGQLHRRFGIDLGLIGLFSSEEETGAFGGVAGELATLAAAEAWMYLSRFDRRWGRGSRSTQDVGRDDDRSL